MNSATVLVTGGSGMVGHALRTLLPDGRYPSRAECDLEDWPSTRTAFRNIRPSVVVHMAGLVGGIQANVAQPWDFVTRNVLINTHAIKAALESGVEYFVAVSSTCAYPNEVPQYPMHEDQLELGPPAKENLPYGYAKRLMSVSLGAAAAQHGLASAVLYACNLYGPYDSFDHHKSHLVSALIRKVDEAKKSGAKELPMLGTGRPLRQFMYVDDLARVIARFVPGRIRGHFNVATPEILSIDQIAETVQSVLGYCVPRSYSGLLDGQFRKDASSDALLKQLPDFRFTPLAEGVRKTWEWYDAHRAVIQ